MAVLFGKKTSALLFAAVFMASWIQPPWPLEQALHCSLTLIAVVLLGLYLRQHAMPERDFALIMLFLAVHSIAARWLYSNVPYDAWLQILTGYNLSEQFGWTRNHFDRLVHFLYGVCFTPAIMSFARNQTGVSRKTAFIIALSAIMISSLCYEWFEWLIALSLSAENAEAYNGQQGDMWDAHKDMLLATLGSLLWLGNGEQAQRREHPPTIR